MIIRSWDFKGILKHFTAIEFSVMSLRGSSCCTGHRAWKSAHRFSTCAHTGSQAPAFMGVSLGQELPPLLPSIGSKMQLPASVEAEMDRGLSIAEGWKRRLSGLSVQNYILFNNVSKHKSSKAENWPLLNLSSETACASYSPGHSCGHSPGLCWLLHGVPEKHCRKWHIGIFGKEGEHLYMIYAVPSALRTQERGLTPFNLF